MIASLLTASVLTGGWVDGETSSTRTVRSRHGVYAVRFTVFTYGAGGVGGRVQVTRARNGRKSVLLDRRLQAGGGVALAPGNLGLIVFDCREDGYRTTATNQRCVATRYAFSPSGLALVKTRVFRGPDYFGEAMWRLYGIPFPKDRWGLVFA